ncbi:sugar phosphate nucleotidyltransferase [Oceaniglobus roseus]|uniref:sugar phosphate nucleotidyltransferase n=1 Tax=Oceaniglobus roseus TaxID=1737570 RepID=UPI000C7F7935|nr:sugar phosphate nucleotidyltransferase [Kandeliimicrobium roseum]
MGDFGEVVGVMLAGGQGTRLHELTKDDCKPFLPFAGNRRIVDWTMANCVRSGLARMIVATQYRPEGLHRHIANFWRPGFADGALSIVHGPAQTGRPEGFVGTADAVTQTMDRIGATHPSEVVVVAADHVYAMDYRPMLEAHRNAGAKVTVAADVVPRMQATGFGVMHCDADGKIRDFVEKPADPPAMPDDPDRALVSMGIYVFDWEWLAKTLEDDRDDPASGHDFGHDILPRAVAEGVALAVRAASPDERPFYWRDVGTLDAYRLAQLDFATAEPPCAIPQYPGLPHAIPSGTGWRNDSIVLPGSWVAHGARVTRSIIAGRAQVPRALSIGTDPEEDRRWFRVSDGGTTLVTQAMLERRAADRAPAYFFGSTPLSLVGRKAIPK